MSETEQGLGAIAKSRKRSKKSERQGSRVEARSTPRAALHLAGEAKKTSIWIDRGVWDFVEDVANEMNRARRGTGESKVTKARVIMTALALLETKSEDERMQLVRTNERHM